MPIISIVHEPEPTEEEIYEKTTSLLLSVPTSKSTEKSTIKSSSTLSTSTTQSLNIAATTIKTTTEDLEVTNSSLASRGSTLPIVIPVPATKSEIKTTKPTIISTSTRKITVSSTTSKINIPSTTKVKLPSTTSKIELTTISSKRILSVSTPVPTTTTKSTEEFTILPSTTSKKVISKDILDYVELLNKPYDHDDDYSKEEETLNEKDQIQNSSQHQLHSAIYPVLLYVVITLLTGFLIITVVIFSVKQYKKSTNPMNYKSNGSKCSNVNANDEFSEVRYLTGDEVLDFTLVTPDRV